MGHSAKVDNLKIEFDGKVVYDPMPHQAKFHTSTAKYRLLGGAAGGGKGERLSALICTPFGFRRFGDLKIGQTINNPDGGVSKVIGIYPLGKKQLYKFSFIDGSNVEVTGEHVWKYSIARKGRWRKSGMEWKLATTEQLISLVKRGNRILIPLTEPVKFTRVTQYKCWRIPPYTLGALLGDAHLGHEGVSLCSVDKEIVDRVKEECGCELTKVAISYNFKGKGRKEVINSLESMGIYGKNSYDKFVPEWYKYSTVEDRFSLVQGLMDTDGYCTKDGKAYFTSTSKKLAEDMQWLIWSLGGKATITDRIPTFTDNGKKKSGRRAYTLYIRMVDNSKLFYLQRKKELASKYNGGGKTLRRRLMSIEPTGIDETMCIKVDNPNGLYITNDFIVTHNSVAVMAEAIMRSMKYNFPLTGAIFRRSFPELESTVVRGMLNMLPNWFYKYNQSQHIMTLKNGSIIEFCYAESDADVYNYQSREWDWWAVDELTHMSEFQWKYLNSRMRTTKPINTKFFAGTNPGNRGHEFVKSRWITKNCQDIVDGRNVYNPDEYDFIPAGIYQNPYLLKNNPDYLTNLKMLPEGERKKLLEGDWDSFEGMFFTEWSPTKHIVDDFDVPSDWRIIMGWDDGTREPRSVHLYAIDNDQRVWCIWEYYKAGENLTDAAANIRKLLEENGYWGRIYKLVVDPSMRRTDSHTGLSSTEVLESMGFGFQIGAVELGENDRVEGWRIMKSYLSHKPYEEPMLKFFKSCGNIIRTLPQLVYYQPRSGAESKKEDLDTSQEDHSADETRYVLMSLERLPSRFESSNYVGIKRRKYSPNSRY